jgi:hypothetical protein
MKAMFEIELFHPNIAKALGDRFSPPFLNSFST